MGKVIFVSGIDTDVGKTVATGIYAKKLMEQGFSVITQKMIQTGCKNIADDLLVHRKIQGIYKATPVLIFLNILVLLI